MDRLPGFKLKATLPQIKQTVQALRLAEYALQKAQCSGALPVKDRDMLHKKWETIRAFRYNIADPVLYREFYGHAPESLYRAVDDFLKNELAHLASESPGKKRAK